MQTHEAFIQAVACAAIARLDDAAARERLAAIKLVYGSGPEGTRGVTFFGRWGVASAQEARPFVEVSAFGQESITQLAGTTVHELAHVLAGPQAGHGKAWREACEALGLRRARAAGHVYHWANFACDLRWAIQAIPRPSDGQPVASLSGLFGAPRMKPCALGIGTRGGKSRGKGSGSRMRLWQCSCGQKVRVASDNFEAVHTPCGTGFDRV